MSTAAAPESPLTESQLAKLTAAVVDSLKAQLSAPQMLDQNDAMFYCGLARSTWFRLRSVGQLPEPVLVVGSGPKWRRRDLDLWISKLKTRK